MIAVARLFLDNVAHIQGSWLTTGKEAGQLSLHYGADDLGSVMLEENVVSSAGAKHRSNRMELIHLIRRRAGSRPSAPPRTSTWWCTTTRRTTRSTTGSSRTSPPRRSRAAPRTPS